MEFVSAGDNEKKAASAPETRADNPNRIIMANNAIKIFRVIGFTVKSRAELSI
jgi:hypothetical protein